jgi:hypothetical protein
VDFSSLRTHFGPLIASAFDTSILGHITYYGIGDSTF